MAVRRSVCWRRVTLLLASLVVCSFFAEITLRVVSPVRSFVNPMKSFHRADPEIGWLGLPDLDARFRQIDFDVRVRNGPDGFRLREGSVMPKSGSPVIAVVGDSFTWGYGVPGGHQFTDVLQARLGPGLSVRNLGINSFSTVQEWMLLRRELSNGLAPRMALLMAFNNDYSDNIDDDATRPRVLPGGSNTTPVLLPASKPVVHPWSRLLKQSYLFSAVAYAFDLRKIRRHAARLAESTFDEGQVSEPAIRAMRWTLGQFKDTCRSNGVMMACAYVPSFEDVRADREGGARSVTRDLCAGLGIPFLDLTPGLRNRGGDSPERLYFEHDLHWSVEGNAAAGEELAVFVRGLLSSPDTPR